MQLSFQDVISSPNFWDFLLVNSRILRNQFTNPKKDLGSKVSQQSIVPTASSVVGRGFVPASLVLYLTRYANLCGSFAERGTPYYN
jgi:hypothetical protein